MRSVEPHLSISVFITRLRQW